jgi:phage/plasmid-like protein (TIGR03299 family)
VTDPNKKSVISPDDGHVHGYFGEGWTLHGYQEWTADKISSILDASRGELGCASVGLLKKRSVAFMQAKLTGTGLEVGGYAAVPFIGAATSVNGSLASTYFTGMEGVVCDNTLDAGMRSALSKTKVKHTKYSAGRVAEIQSALGLVYEAGDAWLASAAELQAIDVTNADFRAWLDEISPVPARDPKSSTGGAKYTNSVKFRDRLTELWTYDPKVKPWAGTAFGIMQLGNTYRTWDRNVSGADGGRMERNLLNMVSGIAAKEDAGDLDALAKVLERRKVMALS